jgi:hypothetical protein
MYSEKNPAEVWHPVRISVSRLGLFTATFMCTGVAVMLLVGACWMGFVFPLWETGFMLAVVPLGSFLWATAMSLLFRFEISSTGICTVALFGILVKSLGWWQIRRVSSGPSFLFLHHVSGESLFDALLWPGIRIVKDPERYRALVEELAPPGNPFRKRVLGR